MKCGTITVLMASMFLILLANPIGDGTMASTLGPSESALVWGVVADNGATYAGNGAALDVAFSGTFTNSSSWTDSTTTYSEDMTSGSSFTVTNGSTVSWTAYVLVSPPPEVETLSFTVDYPLDEWTPVSLTNPLNVIQTIPDDWWYVGGLITVESSAIDSYGLWKFEFMGENHLRDLQLGPSDGALSSSATLDVDDELKVQTTSSWVTGAVTRFELIDPTDSTWDTATNSTSGASSHLLRSFRYRKNITVQHTRVSGDLTDYPVLIDILDYDLYTGCQSDGADIIFVSGSNILSHEIERFDQDYDIVLGRARLTAWVKTNLSASVDTVITMYYGNSLVNSITDTEAVWTQDYLAVWHLNETVTDEATTGTHYDSTSGDYDGNQDGNDEVNTLFSYGQRFDGTDDMINVTLDKGLDPTGDVTISGWFRLDNNFGASSATSQVIMAKFFSPDDDMHIVLVGSDYTRDPVAPGSFVFKVENNDNTKYIWTQTTSWTAGQWYYFVCTMDASNPSNNQIYINGQPDMNITTTGAAVYSNLTYSAHWGIGGGETDSQLPWLGAMAMYGGWFDGSIDEVRISNVDRTNQLGWIPTAYSNQRFSSTFYNVGSESERPSPDHTFKKVMDSSAAAGLWTARALYNDSGSSVNYRVGIYEREFTVQHGSSLTFDSPGDAIGDGVSTRVIGEGLFIAVNLTDDETSGGVTGATITMNWTVSGVPTQLQLDDLGGGRYGKEVNTTDLSTATRWRINIQSSHPYYADSSTFFDLDLYHPTVLTYHSVSSTPVGFDFTATLVYTNIYTGSPITGATITLDDGSPVTVVWEGGGEYNISIPTAALNRGNHLYTFNASKPSDYVQMASVDIIFTLRPHYTTASVSGDLIVPFGEDTQVTVNFIDLDTGEQVTVSDVASFIFTSSEGTQTDNSPLDYDVTLSTSSWSIGSYAVNLSITLASSDYYAPAQYTFNIDIREHYTSVSVTGVLTRPYGNDTPLTVVLTDLDTGTLVDITDVASFTFSSAYGEQPDSATSYDVILTTDNWDVGTTAVTITVVMSGSDYAAPALYDFDVTIRSLATYLHHEPTDLIFPSGDDFVIILRVNVSEPGNSNDGNPILGLAVGEFSARNATYTFPIAIAALGNGRYRLTIDHSHLTDDDYTITVTVDPNSANHTLDTLVISFIYRAARSYLSSPSYPQVTTPYETDVIISLNYTDVDRLQGITTATITSTGIPIYDITNLGNGMYEVTLDLSGRAKGNYEFNLTASAPQYESKTLTFTLTVRYAYAYALPTVGALGIPVGNDPVFYVTYWDTDNDVPIADATVELLNWPHLPTVKWIQGEQRYRIIFNTTDTDTLEQNRIVTFNFSKGENYQLGIFNITVTIRRHNTDFRLVSAVAPTSYNGVINISVYYGDLDNNVGIDPKSSITHTVENTSGLVISSLEDGPQGKGYYIVQINANQLGLGLQTLNVTFSWTGIGDKYQSKWLTATVNIVGVDSRLTLMLASEPTPYSEVMNYTFFYSDLAGIGIDNSTGDVHIYVSFQGVSVDLSEVDIKEIDQSGQPGNYSIGFNNTIFGKIDRFYMNVFINWTEGVTPFYTNRSDVISVGVLARNTLVSIIPPTPTSYGENATLSFTFDDVTGGGNEPIENSSSMIVSLNLANMSMTYDPLYRIFTVSFNTSQFDAPLGQKSFTLDVTWVGVPFYANRTGRVIFITVIQRQTVLEYSLAPTQYRDNVTFSVIWTDVTGAAATGVTGADVALYDGFTSIPAIYYTITELGGGEYEIDFNTTHYENPGLYSLNVTLTTTRFYMPNVTATRSFDVRPRATILSSVPVYRVAYNLSFEVIVYYQDLITFANIGNGSGYASLDILNGTDWIFSCEWIPSQGYYLLTLQSYPVLEVNRNYVLWINMSYADEKPFYRPNQVFIPFELRHRASTIYVTGELPQSTPYNESISFTLFYEDLDSLNGIENGNLTVYKGGSPLTFGVDYQVSEVGSGSYLITVETTALDGIAITQIVVKANWTLGTPYHNNATMSLSLRVVRRETNVEIEVPPSQTRFLDNVTFTFSFIDVGTEWRVAITKADIVIYNDTQVLAPSLYSFIDQGGNLYVISINSTFLSSGLVDDHNVTVFVDWNDSLPPYYSDDQTSIKVTTANRIGSVSLGQVLVTPMNDNMTLSFDFVDEATGVGIGNAEIQFDCVEVPGLIKDVDYWVFAGTGADAGNYTILVDTAVLDTEFQGGISAFNFILDVTWNPSQSPYYQDITGLKMIGGVRLIQISLTNAPPTPATVPYNDNVSIVITFIDLDHASPINGAGANISVRYKNGSIPSIWVWESVGAGVYNVTMDTHDAGEKGIKTLIIEIDFYPYQSLQIQVSFQLRNRYGLLDATVPPAIYAGDSAVVMVTLVDIDAGDASLPGAALNITWPDSFGITDLLNGSYRIDLSTLVLNYGVEQLLIEAAVLNYDVTPLSLDLILKAITTDIVPTEAAIELYWGNSTTVEIFYNDTLRNLPLTDAVVSYTWAGSPGNLLPTGTDGYYTVTLDTSYVNATTVVVFITAQKPNYITVSTQVTLSILPVPMAVTPIGGIFVFSLPRGEAANLNVSIIDSVNGIPVEGATVYAFWSFVNPENATLTDLGGGIYQYTLDTDLTEAAESYIVTVTALKQNHQAGSISFTIAIIATETQVIFDERSESYVDTFFNWSQIIKVGVYVIAPDLNGTDDYHQWNSTVTWRLGTEEGTFEENSSFPLLGHFYFYFNTTKYDATVHSFTITATPRNLEYQRSSNTTLLRILDIPTSLDNPLTVDKIWGWSGWFNFTLWDLYHDTGVDNESYGIDMAATYSWAGGTDMAKYVGNGDYSIFINTTLMTPSREYYPITISFDKDNFAPRSGTFNLRITAIETEIDIFAPSVNQIEGSTINLQVPWSDTIGITLFYSTAGVTTNDTPYVGGISGATIENAKFTHAKFLEPRNISLVALLEGNYTFSFDTSMYDVSDDPYIFAITLSYGNRTESSIIIRIRIVDIPTQLEMVDDIRAIQVVNQGYVTFDLLFTDAWETHGSSGVMGASWDYNRNDTAAISIDIKSHPTIDGRYVVTIFGKEIDETGGFFIITMFKENYESRVTIAISYEVNPNDNDLLVATTVTYVLPFAAVLIMGVILYVKVLKMPKQLRKINGQIKALRKGKMPKPVKDVRSRQELVAELFNDTFIELEMTRQASQMPEVAIIVDIPELGELLVQLSILTHLNTQELDDFKADISKMLDSEQAAFIKEVIHQEAIRVARREGKSVDEVKELVAEEAQHKIRGVEVLKAPSAEPTVLPSETVILPPEDAEAEDVVTTIKREAKVEAAPSSERLSDYEIKELKKDLEQRGVPPHEIDTILEQAKSLPRDLVEDLIRSLGGQEE